MVFTNKLKDCLVKIKVAQYEKKKIVLVKVSSVNLNLLDMLWKEGFIFGYTLTNKFYQIYLKYNSCGVGVLESLLLINYTTPKNTLKKWLLLEPYTSYIVLCDKNQVQLFPSNTLLKTGGKIIAKI